MKLSEAMMLGSATCEMVPRDWNSCALGAAANAVGIKQANIHATDRFTQIVDRVKEITRTWPWLDEGNHTTEIFNMFDYQVCSGKMTFEQLVDYVKSIEPECGECNHITCTCTKEQKEVGVERSASVLG